MRVFLAVDLNDEQRKELNRCQILLSAKLSNIKWVPKDNLHITLKFLGELKPVEIEKIISCIKNPAKNIPAFQIEPGYLGAFPTIKRPRIIWAGLKKGHDEMVNLNRVIEENLSELGFEKDHKPFSPHITLGRFRQPPADKITVKAIETFPPLNPAKKIVGEISIYQSILKPEGPQYKPLHFWETGT